ncbi:MAG: site-specific integrase [Pseudomonadota bacterium]
MPPYLTHKDNTYYFRQSVPAELRQIIGKREIKKSLGRDFPKAVRECKRYAVEADNQIAEARAIFDNLPVDPYSSEGILRTQRLPLTCITPELEKRFGSLMRIALLENDQETRIAGMDQEAFEVYGQHIEDAIKSLRRQLAMGNVEPMLEPARTHLIGRGYDPRLSPTDWRRLAYVMTQATLEAYQGMALRHNGDVVKQPVDDVLPSQYELQNAAAAKKPDVTWQNLYDVWVKECDRRENTKASYLASMKLFMSFCSSAPQFITREDVLAYRDFLLHEKSLAPGTVANKIGFVGTLFNSGRDNSKYVKFLPHNPFEKIRIKQSKRGMAGKKRLPLSDEELKTFFNSPIYTQGFRPRGGGGEAAAWMPAIAYLTGMRLEEIALLKTRQFLVDAEGHPYIHTEDGKNEGSADRDVPLHPALIEAGLLDYVKTCSGRLFPKVKCSDEIQSKSYSKWYGRYLGSLGITEKSKVFHSFRHLFKDLCKNAGLDDSAVDQICGHEPGTVGGRYGIGRRINVLADMLAQVVPPVKVPRIVGRGDRHRIR